MVFLNQLTTGIPPVKTAWLEKGTVEDQSCAAGTGSCTVNGRRRVSMIKLNCTASVQLYRNRLPQIA